MFRHTTAVAASAASVALLLAACGGGSSSGDGTSVGGSIKIGIKFDQPGLGLKSGNDYTGMDVDVATYVAKELGYEPSSISWIQAPSKQRETLIKSGQVNMVVATYSITDARKKEVSFAGPYFVAGQSVLVRSDSDINSVDALKGKKVCSVTGSTSVKNLEEKVSGLVPQQFDTYSKCVEALSSGAIDALTTDDTILAGFANQAAYKGKFKLVGGTFSTENYGIGLKQGDTAMCNKVTDAIKKMIDDGTWKKIVEENLGTDYKYDTAKNPPTPAACS
ncbi:glutamate transport system substrate-binding protein [Branchiibius hedensis]|uniref:Glutamate transport system substrate-binding protein n=1 Tax=Branchiibius hedensis TaxID=672460 RepID=A0A2Y9BTN7_9MICO|nr:glutamate ABC transporter substrate-binding protein [Branchiibius hedensis]PWJ25499.1 glutamate transport system substrate-binding protein [Branchiibius hedensis]SSA34312.1 glutamate transport system substrate-binding protein [Branchiibius hedensis]